MKAFSSSLFRLIWLANMFSNISKQVLAVKPGFATLTEINGVERSDPDTRATENQVDDGSLLNSYNRESESKRLAKSIRDSQVDYYTNAFSWFRSSTDGARMFVLSSNSNSNSNNTVLDYSLTNGGNAIYEIDALIPDTTSFKMLINTASSYSWLINSTCNNCTRSFNTYDKTRSKTYKSLDTRTTISFSKEITFLVKGLLSEDTVRFIGMSKPFLFRFLLVDSMTGSVNLGLDGSLGLAPFDDSTKENSILYHFQKNNLTQSTTFSLLTGNQEQLSSIYFGGYSTSIIKNETDIIYCNNIPGQAYWGCKMKYLKLSNSTLNTTKDSFERNLVFDSVSNILTIPFDDFKVLKNYIFREENDCQYFTDNIFHCTCSGADFSSDISFPTFTFGLENGKELTLYPEDYIYLDTQMTVPDSTCIVAIRLDYSIKDEWILGNNFLRNYYTIYDNDNKRVGFYDTQNKPLDSYGMIVVVTVAVVASAIFLFTTMYCVYKRCVRPGV